MFNLHKPQFISQVNSKGTLFPSDFLSSSNSVSYTYSKNNWHDKLYRIPHKFFMFNLMEFL